MSNMSAIFLAVLPSPSGFPPVRPSSVQGVHHPVTFSEELALAEAGVYRKRTTLSPKSTLPSKSPLPVTAQIEPSLWIAGPAPDIQMPPPLPRVVEHHVAAIAHLAVLTAITHPRANLPVSKMVPKQMITAPSTIASAALCLRSMLLNACLLPGGPGSKVTPSKLKSGCLSAPVTMSRAATKCWPVCQLPLLSALIQRKHRANPRDDQSRA